MTENFGSPLLSRRGLVVVVASAAAVDDMARAVVVGQEEETRCCRDIVDEVLREAEATWEKARMGLLRETNRVRAWASAAEEIFIVCGFVRTAICCG